jgi:adenosylcobinamide-GDP ribazoletransferase
MRVADLARREVRGWAAAVAFLTRIPVGRVVVLDAPDLARGVVAFPIVGALIGAAAVGAGSVLSDHVPPTVAGVLALTVAVALTGALHLDGLADTADAIGGSSPDAALAIMRDPRVGSFGVAAVAVLLLIEANALAVLVAEQRIAPVVASFALARAVGPLIAAALPYARPGPGLARSVAGRVRALAAASVGVVVVFALATQRAPALTACAAVCAVAVAAFSRRRFGGATGDTLGAAVAVTEAACLVVACTR